MTVRSWFDASGGASVVQRWRDRRAIYRPSGETINPLRYEVAELAADAEAKSFVLANHYSGTYPAARRRVGLFRAGALVGVAVFSHPVCDAVLTSVFNCPAVEAIELGRFVLLDDVPGNGETWFLARCFEILRASGLRGVVSFADPQPRRTSTGDTVFPGHIGTIYQAHNGLYLGRATARALRLLPDGQVLSARALQKLRSGERGWRYVAEQLRAAGASPVPSLEARAEWLREELARVTRIVRHHGNHRYAWPLHRRQRVLMRPMPYPKHLVTGAGSTRAVLAKEHATC